MKKTKLTRSLLAACSIVALSVALSGCLHSSDDEPATEPAPIDTDGDGVADDDDAFPNDPDESADSDGDGVGDNADAFPMDATETMDSDMDGVGDNADAFPMDATETMDSDGDGIGDNADPHNVPNDRDNDGVADIADAFPDDPTETRDSDDDGVGNNADAFPLDPMETADSDGDGVGDNADAFPMDAAETMDSDGDGVGNNADAFPMDAAETMDSDMDGVGDNADAFPMDAAETMDSDGDGVGNNADAFPMDAAETMDSDGDGIGDNADAFPMDAAETMDSDGDGVGNNADAFPNDPMETADSDGDGIGDNADAFPNDRDNDGVTDADDAFPDDPTETADSDGDGVGDNEEKRVADTMAAATKATAIATEAAQAVTGGTVGTDGAGGADAGLGGSVDGVAPTDSQVAGEYNLAVEHGKTTITVEGATAEMNEEFVLAMDFGDGRTMHTRTHEADTTGNVMTEVAIVATTIEAPMDVPFAMFAVVDAAGTRTTPQALDTSTDTTNDTPTATNEALLVETADVAHIRSSGLTSAGSGTVTYGGDDPDDMTDSAYTATGTYNGSPGTYMCNGGATDCTVTYDAMGMITAVGGGAWVFTPDAGATTSQPDYDYLTYGFWLKRTTDAMGAVTYNEVETFAMSRMDASDGTTLNTVNGSASYSGGAVGVYVRDVYSEGGGMLESSTSGHFSATATLTANFQGNSIPVDIHNTVTGSITNFELSGGEDNEWR